MFSRTSTCETNSIENGGLILIFSACHQVGALWRLRVWFRHSPSTICCSHCSMAYLRALEIGGTSKFRDSSTNPASLVLRASLGEILIFWLAFSLQVSASPRVKWIYARSITLPIPVTMIVHSKRPVKASEMMFTPNHYFILKGMERA
jgi:hypothetical protein